jgi:malonate transporter
MQALFDVIGPVFLVIGAGYLAASRNIINENGFDALMRFAQSVAIPCMLFSALRVLDLGVIFDPWLLVAFYTGSVTGFAIGLLGARFLFQRPWEDSIAIGFCCLFANSVMIGLALTERAYGTTALGPNYAIVALHSPFCYGVGITAMEIARARGGPAKDVVTKVLKAMFSNALIVAIALGFAFNLLAVTLPVIVTDAVDMLARSALPVALFGMGGILFRYRPEGDLRTIAFICVISLVLHPTITYTLGNIFALETSPLRSAVVTAAMAPGINGYVFANMYGVARRVVATAILAATSASVITAWIWLSVLP